MKKLIAHQTSRKLTLRRETIGILRELSAQELRDGRVAGATGQECKDSPPTIFSEVLESLCC